MERPRFLPIVCVVALVVAACGDEAPEEAPGREGAAEAECQLEDEPVTIGVQGAMSGAHADYGRQIEMGATLAAEEINAEGGILGCEVQLEFADEELDPDVATTNARRFVDELGAHFLTGVDSSTVALALAPVVEELETIFIATHAATEKLTEVEVFEKGNEFVFRVSVPVYQDAIVAAHLFADMPEATRFATIGADYEYGHTSWEMFKDKLSELRDDVEFVGEAWAPFLTTDFSPHISTVMGEDPDVIFATPWAGEAVTLIRQAQGTGVFDEIEAWWQAMGGSVDVLEGVTSEVQADAFEGKLWATGRYIFNYPETETNRQFVETFRERWDRFPNYSAVTTYTAIYAIKNAVEEAGTLEDNAVIEALEGLAFPTPLSDDFFIRAEDHQGVYNVPAGRVVYSDEFGMACVCEDLLILEPDEYYRNPPFEG